MKFKFYRISLIYCLSVAISYGADLTVVVQNPTSTGTVEILLFDSATTFNDLTDPVKSVRIPAAGQETYQMSDIPPGEYAVMVHHDQNENGSLDKNFIGIPREPVGFANGYSPKGPPSYSRAKLRIDESMLPVSVELSRPLGERGRLGAGIGAIVRSSPYRDSDGGTFMPIPAITYTGERVQIFGPRAQIGLCETGPLKYAAVGRYRAAAYQEEDSDFLDGMGNRDATLMGGVAAKATLPARTELTLTGLHDALDQIGGSEASLFLDRTFQFDMLRLTPNAGVNWTAARLANHDYGVSSSKAIAGRPAYDTGDTFSLETGVNALAELNENWWIIANIGLEFLGDDVTDSPIVEDSRVFKGFLAVQYVF